jgi:Holliday junction DNA helicase RuvA
MIARLTGTLLSVEPTCVVNVGGVGFEVQIPEKDRATLSVALGEVTFFTHLYVREDRLTLFGFLNRQDKELFARLIEVSGIGPKIAVRMLGEQATDRIVQAIQHEDSVFLCKLPGLGKRTAERLVIELKDKLTAFDVPATSQLPGVASALREEAVLALTTLGMQRAVAERALDHIDWENKNDNDLADIVKDALKHASGV